MKQREKQRDDEDLRHYLKWITHAENLETEEKDEHGRTLTALFRP